MVGAFRFALFRGRFPKRIVAIFTGSLLLASCSTCTASCGPPTAEVDISRLPSEWLQRATFRLCADTSCTTSSPTAGTTTIQAPNATVQTPIPTAATAGAPKLISLTVSLDKQVVLSATTTRFKPSSAGDCGCGDYIGLRVDPEGTFSKL